MGYITPADVGISDDRAAHIARGSKEPGTDYKTAYGTNLRIPDDCVVLGVDHSNDGAEGRRLYLGILSNGETIDWIHLSRIGVRPGDRLSRGQTDAAWSGASGFGSDWYYDPHLHVTRRARQGLPYSQTLDFEDAIGGGAPASTTAGTIPNLSEEDDMSILFRITDGQRQGTSYTLEPFRGVKAHLNEFGARLALRARNKGAWPPEGQAFEEYRKNEANGELQMPEVHARALLDVYGLTEVAAASNLPAPGELVRVG